MATAAPSDRKTYHVAAKRPKGYESVTTADGLCTKATIQGALISMMEPTQFIEYARATNEVFFNLVDQLPASHPRMRFAAKRQLAATLLKTYDEFKKRLTPKNLELYRQIAWPTNHPLSGAIDSCDPFNYADIWREFLRPIKRDRRRRVKIRQLPKPQPGYKIPKLRLRNPSVSRKKLDEAGEKINSLQEGESDAASYVNISLDFLASAIDILAKGFGASVGGAFVSIASIYLGLIASSSGAIREQYRQGMKWGFAWGLQCYGRKIISAGDAEYLSVDYVTIWSYIKKTPTFTSHKKSNILMGKALDEAVERGVIDAVAFMNGVMIETRRGIKKQVDEYAGIISRSEQKALVHDRIQEARIEAWKYVSGRVALQLKGKSMAI